MEILMIYVKVFVVGGIICSIAQLLIDYTKLTAGRILLIFLLAGVVLQALNLYEPLVEFAKAGATIPISGFGYTLAKGAMEGAKESLFKAITGGVSSAAAGLSAAIVLGYLISLIFSSKSKKN